MPVQLRDYDTSRLHRTVQLLISNLVDLKDSSGEFLLRLDDGRVIDTKGWNDWEWTHGIGLYGIQQYFQLTGEPRCLQIIKDWFRDRFAAGTPTKNVNTMAPFLTLANLYEQYRDPTYVPYLDTWAEWVMHDMPRTEEGGLQHIVFNSENPQQLWDDTLMMCVLPLARIGQVLGRPQYLEEARRQFLLHVKYLHDRRTGLWFHGWTFDGRHNFAEALWARGNCWVTIAIPEFIEMLNLQPRRCAARVPDRHVEGAGPDAAETSGRQRPVAHADRRSFVVPGGVRDGRLRLRHSQSRPPALSAGEVSGHCPCAPSKACSRTSATPASCAMFLSARPWARTWISIAGFR